MLWKRVAVDQTLLSAIPVHMTLQPMYEDFF